MILNIFIILISVVIFGLIGYNWNFSQEKNDENKLMNAGLFALLGTILAISIILKGQ